jgi:ribosomal protein S18 acetylase RimI-like enzyme
MTSIQIQKLQPSDFEECWQVLASWPESERQNKGFFQNQLVLRSFIEQYGGFCSRIGSGIGAFCIVQKVTDIAEILLIAVDHHFSGHGWGGRILSAVLDDLQKQNFSEVWLEVHAANLRALALYQKAGFKITSRRSKYYSDGADALNLKLAFKTPSC